MGKASAQGLGLPKQASQRKVRGRLLAAVIPILPPQLLRKLLCSEYYLCGTLAGGQNWPELITTAHRGLSQTRDTCI